MLDIGWTELVVIAIVLIVVVGPKDLPPMLRAFGRMTSKMRGMASEFRQQFDEALREADLDEVRKTISDAQSLNPANALRDAINPLRQMGNDIKADLQKAATPDQPATPNTVDKVSAVEPAVAPAAVEAATDQDFERHPLLVKGYIGPWSETGPVLGEESATATCLTGPELIHTTTPA